MSEIKYGSMTLTLIPGDTYSVTACEKEAVEVEIPAEVGGIPVTAIGDYAFRGCAHLKRVTFLEASEERQANGECLSEAGVHIFMNCTALKKLSFPPYFRTFGWGAFHSCTALEEVECHPDTYFSGHAFAHCTALRKITPLSTLSEGIFSHCAALTDLPVTDTVDEIPEDAFEHCDGLVDVVIPASVTEIGALAFRGCYELKRVTFACPGGWYGSNSYRSEDVPIDLGDPVDNARCLAWMDFDDGEIRWYKKRP